MSDICIVGVGNVGGALAIALSRAGHRITQLITKNGKVERRVGKLLPPGVKVSRSGLTDQIDAEIILLTVQDQYIEDVAADLSVNVVSGQSVFHASGSLSDLQRAIVRIITSPVRRRMPPLADTRRWNT